MKAKPPENGADIARDDVKISTPRPELQPTTTSSGESPARTPRPPARPARSGAERRAQAEKEAQTTNKPKALAP